MPQVGWVYVPANFKKPTGSIVEESGNYVAACGSLSLVNAGLAQGKGRSGLGWWLLSLFLGPVATFLIVVLPRVEAPPAVQGPRTAGWKN